MHHYMPLLLNSSFCWPSLHLPFCPRSTWDAVVACGFINFVMYTATAVIAFLEWKASKKGKHERTWCQNLACISCTTSCRWRTEICLMPCPAVHGSIC
jgi:hypothetical protein